MARRTATAARRRRLAGLAVLIALATPMLPPAAAASGDSSFAEVVKGFCLSAFQNEMAQAGKQPPAGMANFACACVAERISGGSSLTAARSSCRQATARRYPI